LRGVGSTLLIGITSLFSNWKLWVLVYGVNLFFALFIAFPFNSFFKTSIGDSLAGNESLNRFDYTFISDFLNKYGLGFDQILKQSFFVGALFLLLSIFLMGGIVERFLQKDTKFNFKNFWVACHQNFWRLLRLTIYYLLIHLLIAAIFFKIFSIGGLSPFDLESDTALIFRIKLIGGLYLFFAALVMMFQDYAKLEVVKADDKWITNSALSGIDFVFKHFLSCLILFLIQILLFGLLTFVYITIRKQFFMSSNGTIFLALFLGQIFIFGRVGLKLLRLSVARELLWFAELDHEGSQREKKSL